MIDPRVTPNQRALANRGAEGSRSSVHDNAPPRRPWQPPLVKDLPPLRDLTLQTAIPGDESIF